MSPEPAPFTAECTEQRCLLVVVSVRNECRHVALELPPRAVVTAFTVGGGAEGVDGLGGGGRVDWSKMESKIANGLMEFQKQGVE